MKKLVHTVVITACFIASLTFLTVFAEAQTGKTKKVRFAPGKSSVVIKGAIVRGTEDRYILAAKRGQRMSVKITSIERNANFTVYYAGEMESIEDSKEATDWSGKLSDDNNYVILVGSKRGNATYTLTISIR
jgi:hypothetical protein